MKKLQSDYLIIGAGMFGLHSALLLAKKKLRVVIVEKQAHPFTQASYVNQARVHLGYHYPRSLTTAKKCLSYFDKFVKDFEFAINSNFKKIYAVSKDFSYTSALNFRNFCDRLNIPLEEIDGTTLFKDGSIEAAFLTKEYAFDAEKICSYYIKLLEQLHVKIIYNENPLDVKIVGDQYQVKTQQHEIVTSNLINATYASINEIHQLFGFRKLDLKFESCEIILCRPNERLKNYGITIIDGPFVSLMPFGLTPHHSLTAVMYTPHNESFTNNATLIKETNFVYMDKLAKKYLNESFSYTYAKSLYTTKVVPQSSEVDDSRPTIIKQLHKSPNFWTVFSGKINTIYDLDVLIP